MDAATLLASLAPLTHTERCLRLVALGRQAAAGDADASTCLRALRESERTYERLLFMMAGQDLLHADAMQAALVVVRSCLHPELLEQRLRDQKDARLRRLALCALEQAAAPQEGWTRDRLARLQDYRGDPSPLVAGAASFVLPPQ